MVNYDVTRRYRMSKEVGVKFKKLKLGSIQQVITSFLEFFSKIVFS